MLPKNLPEDINVELLLSYYPEGSCKVAFKELYKRNAYKDITDIKEDKRDGTLRINVGRHSLYNALPEYMFHQVDRFDNPKANEKDRFSEEYEKQEQEREDAYRFFAPLDLLLLKLRVKIRERLQEYVERNKVLTDIIVDQLSDEQKSNRFIRRTFDLIPSCKYIRGDKTLLTFMLRKIFMEEGLKIEKHRKLIRYTDEEPRYQDGLDSILGEGYVGNIFDEETTIYDIHYWSDDDCDENFLLFIHETEVFRHFIQDYFISIEETLHFNIYKDDEPLRLSDDMVFNYLNYNTNL